MCNFIDFLKRNGYELTYEPPIDSKSVERLTSLEGIQAFQSFFSLKFSGNAIVDLSPIADMITLRSVDFSYNAIECIDHLSLLKDLNWINLEGNPIEDIQYLGCLNSLESLNVNDTKITSIKGLPMSLVDLSIARCPLISLDGLSELISLDTLNLSADMILSHEDLLRGLPIKDLIVEVDSQTDRDQISLALEGVAFQVHINEHATSPR